MVIHLDGSNNNNYRLLLLIIGQRLQFPDVLRGSVWLAFRAGGRWVFAIRRVMASRRAMGAGHCLWPPSHDGQQVGAGCGALPLSSVA